MREEPTPSFPVRNLLAVVASIAATWFVIQLSGIGAGPIEVDFSSEEPFEASFERIEFFRWVCLPIIGFLVATIVAVIARNWTWTWLVVLLAESPLLAFVYVANSHHIGVAMVSVFVYFTVCAALATALVWWRENRITNRDG
jgi:hypothetical protein